MKPHDFRILEPLEFLFYHQLLQSYEGLYINELCDVTMFIPIDSYSRDHGFSSLFYSLKWLKNLKIADLKDTVLIFGICMISALGLSIW